MSARGEAGAAYARMAWQLRKGEPLPPDDAAWLADRLADVSRVLLDGDNTKPDSAVMVALGTRGVGRNGATAQRDRGLAERVEHHRRENPGRPLKALYVDVAREWPLWAVPGMPQEFQAIADSLRVSDAVVRRAYETRHKP